MYWKVHLSNEISDFSGSYKIPVEYWYFWYIIVLWLSKLDERERTEAGNEGSRELCRTHLVCIVSQFTDMALQWFLPLSAMWKRVSRRLVRSDAGVGGASLVNNGRGYAHSASRLR